MLLRTLIVLVIPLTAQLVRAQDRAPASPGSSEADDEARQHFERGVELYREGSFDAALVEFERTYQFTHSYKVLYNLGQIQAERHEYVAASSLLSEYLSKGGSEVPAERRQAVLQDLAKFKQRIATLTIAVNVDGAEVFVNDVSRGVSPLSVTVPVNTGTCQVRAAKAGYATAVQNVTAAGGERHHVTLTLAKEPAVVATGPEGRQQQPSPPVPNLTPFWISLGSTVVLGAATAVFAALATGADSDLKDVLDDVPAQAGDLDSARSRLRTFAGLTDGFGAAAVVAAGFTVYFLLDAPAKRDAAPERGAVHARVVPAPTGLTLTGSF